MANSPDVLGVITRDKRLTLDMAELALAVQPAEASAGQPFKVVLLIQNAANCDIDAMVRLIVPDKDAGGTRGQFATKADKKIAIGLRAAEVGYVSLPVLANPATKPSTYSVQVEVEIVRKERNPQRIRPETGGTPINLNKVTADIRQEIETLQALPFSVQVNGRVTRTAATLTCPFTLTPPQVTKAVQEASRAGWKSLWTIGEGLDDEGIAEQARQYTSIILPQLTRRHIFFPLMKATQAHAEKGGYRLWAGEALMITKLLTLTLETGQPTPSLAEETVTHPHWFIKLCQLLLKTPDLTNQPEQLVTELLYPELIHDATLSGFTLLKSATPEDLGSQQEMFDYGDALAKSFNGEGEPLDFVHVYLPLVLGGLLSNSRLLMPEEHVLDSLELIINARIQREEERYEGNQFVFDLNDALIDRALAQVDRSLTLQRYLDPIERLQIKR